MSKVDLNENTREIYESLYPHIFVGHYGILSKEFDKPFDWFGGYDYLVDIIEEKNKEIQKLKEENYRLKDYINTANVCEWFKGSNLEELIKEEDEE